MHNTRWKERFRRMMLHNEDFQWWSKLNDMYHDRDSSLGGFVLQERGENVHYANISLLRNLAAAAETYISSL